MLNDDEVQDRKLQFRQKVAGNSATVYERKKVCPECGGTMVYIYGEMYECPDCGCKSLSDFGKVRKYLEDNGPQTAIVIAEATGVAMDVIHEYLRDGRVEIPDGSEQYIKCQKCGAEIRYGRFCPECMKKMSGSISQALWQPDVGEKPKRKQVDGKMHFLNEENVHHRTR